MEPECLYMYKKIPLDALRAEMCSLPYQIVISKVYRVFSGLTLFPPLRLLIQTLLCLVFPL